MHDELAALLTGQVDAICFGRPRLSAGNPSTLIFPGSFNPLHSGHRRMAQIAAERLGRPVEFEISVANVDKPPLTRTAVERRLQQFDAGTPVWVTRATTFVEKARLFPGATMIVGADTAIRVGSVRYYAGRAARDAALANFMELECRFLVFGRQCAGRFQTLDTLDLPAALADLCHGVPASVFRDDSSSSAIRDQA